MLLNKISGQPWPAALPLRMGDATGQFFLGSLFSCGGGVTGGGVTGGAAQEFSLPVDATIRMAVPARGSALTSMGDATHVQ